MTRLFNDPVEFTDEMAAGFALANSRWVRRVSGGVIRSTRSESATVALVIGGGSGHYPAFAGLVGPGLADGAVMGNLFASPSSKQVESVVTQVERGRGALLSFGNYAGDVLQFGEAQKHLREKGIDCRSVAVTDDIFSAPLSEREKRRGIAGDLAVFKVAGAAARAGYDIDGVERIAQRANDRTRSMGVAFAGCALPGASEPLFDVPAGRMAIGLGIHGERGIGEVDMPTADGLAELFVESLLVEVPEGLSIEGASVVPILNGLGSIKYEELFVVFRRVHALLEARGIVVVDPQVGEFCTSFDMAGASLTLFWLDDELERLWLDPVETPGFRRGGVVDVGVETRPDTVAIGLGAEAAVIPDATVESRWAALQAVRVLGTIRDVLDGHAAELGRIDAVSGDGDHGIGMQRGSLAAADAAASAAAADAGLRTTLRWAADAWSDRGGGTSGALWAVILRCIGDQCGDNDMPTPTAIATGVEKACDGVMSFGKASLGDKTMVDAMVPFAASLSAQVRAGRGLATAWAQACAAATEAATATADLVPRIGRARSHGVQAVGTPDPGAVSFALIVGAVSDLIGTGPWPSGHPDGKPQIQGDGREEEH